MYVHTHTHAEASESLCGNGMVDELEHCDDGGSESNDGCSSTCTVEYGYECMNEESMLSSCMYTCGDGLIAVGSEECDDGNEEDGDGCSSECVIEYGYECMNEEGMASMCVAKGQDPIMHAEGVRYCLVHCAAGLALMHAMNVCVREGEKSHDVRTHTHTCRGLGIAVWQRNG